MNIHIKRTIGEKETDEQIIAHLIKDRGIKDVVSFLAPRHPTEIALGSFFEDKKTFQKNWTKFIILLKKIKKDSAMIVVYMDYDADGITGGAVMWETLHKLGFKVMPFVPDRKLEGYGFSEKGIDRVRKEFNPALIISVDHGIVAHEKITYAKKLGIQIVVTDHHQKKKTEPEDALLVFHTDKLSGSGVAYFVAKEIYNSLKKSDDKLLDLSFQFTNDYLSLASIGTIADLVPLVNESRSVAKYGLEAFSKTKKAGLREILVEARLDNKKISTYDVGYIIAPRINVFGRLEHGLEALRLLCTGSPKQAHELASRGGKINKNRQDIVETSVQQAIEQVDSSSKIIIVYSDQWEEGVIGLIASKLMNLYYRPVIVMTQSDGFVKGSARSVSGINITAFLRDLQNLLIDVGGHAAAAGFSIAAAQVDEFTKKAQQKAQKEIKKALLVKKIHADVALPLKKVSLNLAKKILSLEPFGIGNPTPTFLSQGIIQDIVSVGKDGSHIKLLLRDEDIFLELIYFRGAEEAKKLKRGAAVKILYNLQVDEWNGKEKVKGIVKYAIIVT